MEHKDDTDFLSPEISNWLPDCSEENVRKLCAELYTKFQKIDYKDKQARRATLTYFYNLRQIFSQEISPAIERMISETQGDEKLYLIYRYYHWLNKGFNPKRASVLTEADFNIKYHDIDRNLADQKTSNIRREIIKHMPKPPLSDSGAMKNRLDSIHCYLKEAINLVIVYDSIPEAVKQVMGDEYIERE